MKRVYAASPYRGGNASDIQADRGVAVKFYVLVRDSDESGVSGTGHVAWAVEFPHGLVAVTFRDDTGLGVRAGIWYRSLDDAVAVHGHGGATRFVAVDRPVGPYADGALNFALDDVENVPLACFKGGVPDPRILMRRDHAEERVAGYIDAARRYYGKDWRSRVES